MIRVGTLFLLIVGLLWGWLYWRQSQAEPAVATGFIESDEVRVGSRIGGRVAEVFVEEGQIVAVGEALYRLDPYDLQEKLAEAEAVLATRQAEHQRLVAGFRREEIAQARARRDQSAAMLEKLVAGARPLEINIAREKVNVAEANYELARSEHERLSSLIKVDSAAKSEYDAAVRALKAATAELASTRAELALLEEGTRAEEIAAARAAMAEAEAAAALLESGFRAENIAEAAAQVDAAQAQVAAIRIQVSELTVSSPCQCEVQAIDLRPGDLVAAHAPAVSLLDGSRMWVRTYVPQGHLGMIRMGQTVEVRVDSLPDLKLMGKVAFISVEGEFTPRNIQTPAERGRQVFRIKVTLTGNTEGLRAGMSADVRLGEAG